MLTIDNVSLNFGDRSILRDVNFSVNLGERVALVGPNGAGKSTLLKVCAGELRADGGQVSIPNRATMGYLPQEVSLPPDRPLIEEVMTVFDEAHNAMAEMRVLETRMAEVDPTSDEFMKIADRYDHLQHEVVRLDAWTAEARAARVLHGLGFHDNEFRKPCGAFSGGWQMRCELGKVLLKSPDVLLLDEPTNYLDIETMIWLENWLKASDAAIVFVSHERAFMDSLAQRVVEVAAGQWCLYKGNYSDYLVQREERRYQQQAAFDNQQLRIKAIEDFAARFRAKARKASSVQSKLKEIDRMEKVEAPPAELKTIHFRFPEAPRSNKVMLQLDNVTKRYGNATILQNVDFKLHRGEKIAIVGLNGAGKSTFIKLLSGVEPPTEGTVRQGEMTLPSYFAQYQYDDLTPQNTVYNELLAQSTAGQGQLVRNIAGAFLFKDDDIEKQIQVLSGGEKTRLRLAKMLMGSANCLLLDEPTNHLDVTARATLEKALQSFDGGLILVSHDRVFVDRVVNKIYEVKDRGVREYFGSYAEYVANLQTESDGSMSDGQASTLPGGKSAAKPTPSPATTAAAAAAAPKAASKAPAKPAISPKDARRLVRKLEDEVSTLEAAIMELETTLANIETDMAKPANYQDGAAMARLTALRQTEQKKLDEVVTRWTKAGEELEGLRVVAEG